MIVSRTFSKLLPMSIGTPFGRGRELPDSYGAWLFVVTGNSGHRESPYPSPPRGHSPEGSELRPDEFQRSTALPGLSKAGQGQSTCSNPCLLDSTPAGQARAEQCFRRGVGRARAQGAPETGGRPERRKQSLEPVAQCGTSGPKSGAIDGRRRPQNRRSEGMSATGSSASTALLVRRSQVRILAGAPSVSAVQNGFPSG